METLFYQEYLELRKLLGVDHIPHEAYELFITSLYTLLAAGSIDDKNSIISLAKMFFAKNEKEAAVTEKIFNDCLLNKFITVNEEIKVIQFKPQEKAQAKEQENLTNEINFQNNQPNADTIDKAQDTQNETVTSEKSIVEQNERKKRKRKEETTNQWFDVNLHLSESSNAGKSKKLSVQLDGNHFMLHDESIMPFSIRYLSQKSRKAFQTNNQVNNKEIDLSAMVKEYCSNKFFDKIIYKRGAVNQSNIVLFSDRFGSMLSYEYLEEHLVRSFKIIPECIFEHYFFYNLPELHNLSANNKSRYYKLNNAERGRKPLLTNNAKWNKDTTFIIFSDAGAHSGVVKKERIKASIDFWNHLVKFSRKIFWLNPVPIREMNDCTAKRLNLYIKMYEPDFVEFEKLFKKAATFA